MFDMYVTNDTYILTPMEDGERWFSDDKYAVKLKSKHMSREERAAGEGEYVRERGKEDTMKKDSYPDLDAIPSDSGNHAVIIQDKRTVRREYDDKDTDMVVLTSKFRRRVYGKEDEIYIDKAYHDAILSMYPIVSIFVTRRLQPIMYIEGKTTKYDRSKVIGMVAECINWE